jgi:hypothetical protein
MGTVGQSNPVKKVKKVSQLAAVAALLTLALAMGVTARAQTADALRGGASATNAATSDAAGDNVTGDDATPANDNADATGNTSAAPTDDTGLPNAPQSKLKGYVRPTQKVKLVNYLFDAYGPFPLVGAALVAGVNQADGTPREWGGGIGGFGRRWGSNYGIGAITTTTRYGMAEMLREDTLYYRCQCTGFFPRFGHALISTFTGRRGEDGHRVFSVPSLVAPYVGEMVAVYAWYPSRYDAKDAFRQANYSLLAYAGGNVALEFFPSGPHSLLSRMHLQNRHGAPENSN